MQRRLVSKGKCCLSRHKFTCFFPFSSSENQVMLYLDFRELDLKTFLSLLGLLAKLAAALGLKVIPV